MLRKVCQTAQYRDVGREQGKMVVRSFDGEDHQK